MYLFGAIFSKLTKVNLPEVINHEMFPLFWERYGKAAQISMIIFAFLGLINHRAF